VRRLLAVVAVVAAASLAGAAYVHQAQPTWWVRLWYPLMYRQEVVGYARIYDLDPALVAAVIYEESRFQRTTRSHAGAVGLMQLLPDTARGIAARTGGRNFRVDDLLTADINIRYGCWYLRHLRRKYARHADGDALALAAYNAGQANVDAWIARTPPGESVEIPFAATRTYVRHVQATQRLYRRAYADELGYGVG
jgi:soluble lytic murein transglycosylase